jgi:hypothetical protein
MDIWAVREAVAAAAGTVDGLRGYAAAPPSPTFPALIVKPPNRTVYHRTAGSARAIELVATVHVSTAGGQLKADETLSGLMSYGSVPAAIEAVTDDAIQEIVVTGSTNWREIPLVDEQGQEVGSTLAADLVIDIKTPPPTPQE